MSWSSIIGPAIGAAASLGSAYLGANASRDASRTQLEAADRAAALYGPQNAIGQNALQGLYNNWGGSFQASPGYAFRRGEAMRAVDAGMSARGLRNSTARDRAAARYADGLASQEFGDWWNRGAGIAGIGQTATNALAGIYGQAGQAAAAGGMGAANAWGGALQNLGNIAANYRW
jgi:hypothetical protein